MGRVRPRKVWCKNDPSPCKGGNDLPLHTHTHARAYVRAHSILRIEFVKHPNYKSTFWRQNRAQCVLNYDVWHNVCVCVCVLPVNQPKRRD